MTDRRDRLIKQIAQLEKERAAATTRLSTLAIVGPTLLASIDNELNSLKEELWSIQDPSYRARKRTTAQRPSIAPAANLDYSYLQDTAPPSVRSTTPTIFEVPINPPVVRVATTKRPAPIRKVSVVTPTKVKATSVVREPKFVQVATTKKAEPPRKVSVVTPTKVKATSVVRKPKMRIATTSLDIPLVPDLQPVTPFVSTLQPVIPNLPLVDTTDYSDVDEKDEKGFITGLPSRPTAPNHNLYVIDRGYEEVDNVRSKLDARLPTVYPYYVQSTFYVHVVRKGDKPTTETRYEPRVIKITTSADRSDYLNSVTDRVFTYAFSKDLIKGYVNSIDVKIYRNNGVQPTIRVRKYYVGNCLMNIMKDHPKFPSIYKAIPELKPTDAAKNPEICEEQIKTVAKKLAARITVYSKLGAKINKPWHQFGVKGKGRHYQVTFGDNHASLMSNSIKVDKFEYIIFTDAMEHENYTDVVDVGLIEESRGIVKLQYYIRNIKDVMVMFKEYRPSSFTGVAEHDLDPALAYVTSNFQYAAKIFRKQYLPALSEDIRPLIKQAEHFIKRRVFKQPTEHSFMLDANKCYVSYKKSPFYVGFPTNDLYPTLGDHETALFSIVTVENAPKSWIDLTLYGGGAIILPTPVVRYLQGSADVTVQFSLCGPTQDIDIIGFTDQFKKISKEDVKLFRNAIIGYSIAGGLKETRKLVCRYSTASELDQLIYECDSNDLSFSVNEDAQTFTVDYAAKTKGAFHFHSYILGYAMIHMCMQMETMRKLGVEIIGYNVDSIIYNNPENITIPFSTEEIGGWKHETLPIKHSLMTKKDYYYTLPISPYELRPSNCEFKMPPRPLGRILLIGAAGISKSYPYLSDPHPDQIILTYTRRLRDRHMETQRSLGVKPNVATAAKYFQFQDGFTYDNNDYSALSFPFEKPDREYKTIQDPLDLSDPTDVLTGDLAIENSKKKREYIASVHQKFKDERAKLQSVVAQAKAIKKEQERIRTAAEIESIDVYPDVPLEDEEEDILLPDCPPDEYDDPDRKFNEMIAMERKPDMVPIRRARGSIPQRHKVIVIDEWAMFSRRQWEIMMERIEKDRSFIIALGDHKQIRNEIDSNPVDFDFFLKHNFTVYEKKRNITESQYHRHTYDEGVILDSLRPLTTGESYGVLSQHCKTISYDAMSFENSIFITDNHYKCCQVNLLARDYFIVKGKPFPVRTRTGQIIKRDVNDPGIWWNKTKMSDIPVEFRYEPAYAVTADIVQGDTLDCTIYLDAYMNRNGALYTAVTRVRSPVFSRTFIVGVAKQIASRYEDNYIDNLPDAVTTYDASGNAVYHFHCDCSCNSTQHKIEIQKGPVGDIVLRHCTTHYEQIGVPKNKLHDVYSFTEIGRDNKRSTPSIGEIVNLSFRLRLRVDAASPNPRYRHLQQLIS